LEPTSVVLTTKTMPMMKEVPRNRKACHDVFLVVVVVVISIALAPQQLAIAAVADFDRAQVAVVSWDAGLPEWVPTALVPC